MLIELHIRVCVRIRGLDRMLLYLYYNYSSVVQEEDIVIEEDKNQFID